MKLYETLTAENWTKGVSGCLINHLIRLGLDDVIDSPEYARLIEAITLFWPERVPDPYQYTVVFEFNDHPDTTLEDVIRVCKVADV